MGTGGKSLYRLNRVQVQQIVSQRNHGFPELGSHIQTPGDIRIFWKKGAKGFGIAHGEAENPTLNVTS